MEPLNPLAFNQIEDLPPTLRFNVIRIPFCEEKCYGKTGTRYPDPIVSKPLERRSQSDKQPLVHLKKDAVTLPSNGDKDIFLRYWANTEEAVFQNTFYVLGNDTHSSKTMYSFHYCACIASSYWLTIWY